MKKMNNDEKKNNNNKEEVNNKIAHIIPLGYQKQRESLFIQKGKEYMRNKKAVSMKHIFGEKEKISININQNININANIKTPEKEPQIQKGIKKSKKEKIVSLKAKKGR